MIRYRHRDKGVSIKLGDQWLRAMAYMLLRNYNIADVN
jgi:hypothetical protein